MLIDVVLVVALGTHGMNKTEALERFDAAKAYYAEMGVEFRLKRVRVRRKSPYDQHKSVYANERIRQLIGWEKYFARRRNTAVLKLAITPPVFDKDGLWYVAGYASGTCSYKSKRNPVGLVNGSLVNPQGLSRSDHITAAIAHELGHLLGAEHAPEQPCSLMSHGMLGCVVPGERVPWATKSVDQILTCIF